MRPLLSAVALSFLTSIAHAANPTSERILALSSAKQRVYWTDVLHKSGEMCNQVVKVMYQGGRRSGVDDWSIGCRDGNAYQAVIEPNDEGTTSLIGCDEVGQLDTMRMSQIGKPPSTNVGCWRKY